MTSSTKTLRLDRTLSEALTQDTYSTNTNCIMQDLWIGLDDKQEKNSRSRAERRIHG